MCSRRTTLSMWLPTFSNSSCVFPTQVRGCEIHLPGSSLAHGSCIQAEAVCGVAIALLVSSAQHPSLCHPHATRAPLSALRHWCGAFPLTILCNWASLCAGRGTARALLAALRSRGCWLFDLGKLARLRVSPEANSCAGSRPRGEFLPLAPSSPLSDANRA